MGITAVLIFTFLFFFSQVYRRYLTINKSEVINKKSNVIYLQMDGSELILYKGKIKELIKDYHKFLAEMDIVVYSKSLFIGFINHHRKQSILEIPVKAIQSVRFEPNKITIQCLQEVAGTKKIIIKGASTQQLYTLSRKLNFILRRSKKASVI
ncbi:hypothetical protein [Vulcanibacillus modesticaldus]|nr:hypothetical protein [Vulcanibacillus modesticaldus]